MTEDARELIDDLRRGKGFSFCNEDSAGIAFAMTPEDYTAFYSAASINGYMISDLLVILMREYAETHKNRPDVEDPEEDENVPECCQDIADLFRLYAELGQEVDDIKDEVRFIRRVLSCRRC